MIQVYEALTVIFKYYKMDMFYTLPSGHSWMLFTQEDFHKSE